MVLQLIIFIILAKNIKQAEIYMKRLLGILSFFSAIFWSIRGLLLIVDSPFFMTGLIILTLSISYLAALKVTKFWTSEIVGMRNIYIC